MPQREKKKEGIDDKKTALPGTGGKKVMVRLGAATAMALTGLAAYHAMQAVAATATLPIMARLVRAIELTVNTTLNFGTLAMTVDRAGNATIDPELNRLFIDNNSSLSLAGGDPEAGRLMVRGADFPVAISIEDTLVKLTNGEDTVTITNFNIVTAKGGVKMTFTPTDASYSFTVPVGATINTRTGQISGTYVGATRIFASYQ